MESHYYIGVSLNHLPRLQYFSYQDDSLKKNDFVLVETARGIELGEVKTNATPTNQYKHRFALMPVLRKAKEHEVSLQNKNDQEAKQALIYCRQQVQALKLPMDMVSAEYNFDRSKLFFNFIAEDRVDFRDLIRALSSRFHTRIDLRQIGARDRAKLYGGIGICGLPLCCTTFLNEFDNISITRAKNQMLTLNIPQLTGHCGKLLCCLKYEDDAYTALKAALPKVGDKYQLQGMVYRVTSMNVLSRMIKIENQDRQYQFIHVDELNKLPKAST